MNTLPNSQENEGKQNTMEALWNAEPQAPDRATRQVRRLASAGFLCRSRGFFTVKLGETWKMPPVTTGNAAEMDLKWWKAIFKGSWCQPNVLIMWGIGNCLSHHGPACHRVVISPRDPASFALELLPGRTSRHQSNILTLSKGKPTAPEHPPKLWAPAASLSSMTSMSSSDRILPHFGECLSRVF